jgi:hypothetical protein
MTITGRVTDSQTNEPIEGATVALMSNNVALAQVAANSNGLFSIGTDQSANGIAISSIGYTAAAWTLPDNINKTAFTLAKKSTVLDDVVITTHKRSNWLWLIVTGFSILIATNKKK